MSGLLTLLALLVTLIIPAAVVTNNPRYRRRVIAFDGQQSEYKEITDSGVVYGAGLSPVGLQISVPMSRRMRTYAAGAVGALWLTQEMPEPEARRFNYSFEFGGGLDIAAGTTRVVVTGFKFHHLSNLNTAREKPWPRRPRLLPRSAEVTQTLTPLFRPSRFPDPTHLATSQSGPFIPHIQFRCRAP